MHYYKRNLGDYAKKAGRLSMLQHGSYTLLIDACYDREQFPTLDEAIEWTWASTTEEVEAVQFVLRKFFTLEDGVYVQKRIQEEIAEYQRNAATNKRIADEREAKRKESKTTRERTVHDASPLVNEPPPNHKPLTTNHSFPGGKESTHASQPDDLPVPEKKASSKRQPKTALIPLPLDFAVSDGVRTWAQKAGHTHLDERLEDFIGKAKSRDYRYADWDAGFQNAIRNDWAGINSRRSPGMGGGINALQARNQNAAEEFLARTAIDITPHEVAA